MTNPLPTLTPHEFAALRESIRDRGQLEPIVVSAGPACEGEIGDGHHRQQACAELGVEPRVKRRAFDTEAEFRLYQLDINLKRRHLTVAQRIEMGAERLPWEQEIARTRQGTRTDLEPPRSPTQKSERATERTAAAVGLKPSTFERGLKVLREAPAEIANQLRTGDLTVNAAYLKTRTAERRQEALERPPVQPPTGCYSLLYVDPPWQYEHLPVSESRAVENHYPTMTLEALKTFDVPAADDAVLFMWATNPKLGEALELIDAWGFSYRTNAVWVKDRIGMGYYVRAQHELLLIARRGEMSPPNEFARPASVIHAPRLAHSAKPESVYELLERMYPGVPRIELFARSERDGWDSWGNEVAA